MQILRSVLSIIESACFILAFRHLPLGDAHSIGSLTPVIVVVLSVIILKEYVPPKTWIAIFIGFVGVLIIMRPGFSIFDPKSIIPLVASFFLGLYQITTRQVSQYDPPGNFFILQFSSRYFFDRYFVLLLLATINFNFFHFFYFSRYFFFFGFIFSNYCACKS